VGEGRRRDVHTSEGVLASGRVLFRQESKKIHQGGLNPEGSGAHWQGRTEEKQVFQWSIPLIREHLLHRDPGNKDGRDTKKKTV